MWSNVFLIIIELFHKIFRNNNWDGNGAAAPSEKVLNVAINFLTSADEYDLPVYFTAPGPNGEIVLEYKNGKNTAEIFFEEDNIPEMILYTEKEQVYAGTIQLSQGIQLNQLINHLQSTTITHAG